MMPGNRKIQWICALEEPLLLEFWALGIFLFSPVRKYWRLGIVLSLEASPKGHPGIGSFWRGEGDGPTATWFMSHIPHSQSDPNRFDRDRLFRVVAQGVPEDLAGLSEYLRRTSKYLTDSEYTGMTRPADQSLLILLAMWGWADWVVWTVIQSRGLCLEEPFCKKAWEKPVVETPGWTPT